MNTDLKDAPVIVLRRLKNGWLINQEKNGFLDEKDIGQSFCFENTKSLIAKLFALIGESKWRMEITTPERGEGGRFLPKPKLKTNS